MSDLPLQIVVLEPVVDSGLELLKVIGKSNQVEIIQTASSDEALQVVQQFLPCIFLISIRGSLDGKEQVELLKKLKKNIHSGALKVMVISSVKNHPEARSISSLGITDYAEEPTPLRSLMFKLNLLFKAVRGFRDKAKQKSDEKIVFKSDETKPAIIENNVSGEGKPKFKPALQFGEDIFVFKNQIPKKIGGKFIMNVEGPLPELGEWLKEPELSESGETLWRWNPLNTDNNKKTEESKNNRDGWIHAGEEPTFNNKTGQWQLKSEKPEIFFRKNGKKEAIKVELEANGTLAIAEDSRTAIDTLMAAKTEAQQLKEKKLNELKEEKARNQKIAQLEEEKASFNKLKLQAKEKEEKITQLKEMVSDKKMREEQSIENQSELISSQYNVHSLSNKEAEAKNEISQNKELEEKNNALKLKEQEKANKANIEKYIKTQERKLHGLHKEDLEGEANLRDRMRENVSLRAKEKEEIEDKKLNKKNIISEIKQTHDWKKLKEKSEKIEELKKDSTSEKKEDSSKFNNLKNKKKEKKEINFNNLSEESKNAPSLQKNSENGESNKTGGEINEKLKNQDRDIKEKNIKNLNQESELDGLKNKTLPVFTEKNNLQSKGRVDLKEIDENTNGSVEWDKEENEDKRNLDIQEIKKKERIFRAIDSIDPEEQKDFWSKDKNSEKIYYLPLEEVQPTDGAWDENRKEWVYLPNFVFDRGLGEIASIMPLWVYYGRQEPELLKEEKKWRFLGSEPKLISNEKELPKKIRELLDNLKYQSNLAHGNINDETLNKIEDQIRNEDKNNPFHESDSLKTLYEETNKKSTDDIDSSSVEEALEDEKAKKKKVSLIENKFKETSEIKIKDQLLEDLGKIKKEDDSIENNGKVIAIDTELDSGKIQKKDLDIELVGKIKKDHDPEENLDSTKSNYDNSKLKKKTKHQLMQERLEKELENDVSDLDDIFHNKQDEENNNKNNQLENISNRLDKEKENLQLSFEEMNPNHSSAAEADDRSVPDFLKDIKDKPNQEDGSNDDNVFSFEQLKKSKAEHSKDKKNDSENNTGTQNAFLNKLFEEIDSPYEIKNKLNGISLTIYEIFLINAITNLKYSQIQKNEFKTLLTFFEKSYSDTKFYLEINNITVSAEGEVVKEKIISQKFKIATMNQEIFLHVMFINERKNLSQREVRAIYFMIDSLEKIFKPWYEKNKNAA